MRTLDIEPLYRTTVGFDRLFEMLENGARPDWPPYNIEKISDEEYRISMAVAGFGPDEIDLTQNGTDLTVTGQRKVEQDGRQVLHRGLAIQDFTQIFKLADHVRVTDARLANGLLAVDLVREVPEKLRPRQIKITSGQTLKKPGMQIEHEGHKTETAA